MIRKEEIKKVAFILFADQGYNAVSTYRIARIARVSEGLIFKHFKSKENLMKVLLDEVIQNMQTMTASIRLVSDARLQIINALNLPFSLSRAELENWRFWYRLRWEMDLEEMQTNLNLETILTDAFKKLGSPMPLEEAQMVLFLFEGAMKAAIDDRRVDKQKFKILVKHRYRDLLNQAA